MSKKRKSDTSTDVIRFDEYMEKGIPESLLEGLGLDVDEEANKQSDEDIDQKLEEVNESTKDENCQIITEKISSYKGSISVEDYPLVSKNNSSDLNINKIDTISSINNNHSGKSKESLKYNNFPKRSSLGSNVNSNNQQNFIINDPVAKILASQIESIAGNVTEMEKQKLLRKCINYANDKSVNLEPASVIKMTPNHPHSIPIAELNPNNDFPIDETNINEVLENSIKSTQNLRYLLSAFKEDLRRVGITTNSSSLNLTKEQLRKKQEVAEKLKHAYETYKKSVRRNIEKSRCGMGNKFQKRNVIADEVIELSEDSD